MLTCWYAAEQREFSVHANIKVPAAFDNCVLDIGTATDIDQSALQIPATLYLIA